MPEVPSAEPWIVPEEVTAGDWLDFLAGTKLLPGRTAPPMPDPTLQSSFVGSSGRDALVEASVFCLRMVDEMNNLGLPNASVLRILDFGCGWGRLYRIMLRLCPPKNLIGSDLRGECVLICRSAMPYGTFVKTELNPPFPFHAQTFDCVYAYSIFSHLSETMFGSYLRDFVRILRSGGIVVFTTLKQSHIEVWKRQAGKDPRYTNFLAEVRFDYEKWRRQVNQGRFLFVPTGGGHDLDGTFYGEAVISEAFLQLTSASLGFVLRVFDEGDTMPQTFVVLQKAS